MDALSTFVVTSYTYINRYLATVDTMKKLLIEVRLLPYHTSQSKNP